MVTYTVTAPDGYEYDVDAPDDATEAQVLAYAKANYSPLMDQVAGEAVKAAVMPLTAPAQMLASKDPGEMPDADTINTVAERGKKVWETAGIPARGIEGLTSIASDVGGALRHGEMPPGEDWKTVVQRASDVVEGKQHLPRVAGFLAGALDPRGLAMGEALNPMVKWGATAVANKMGPIADWLAERVLGYSKRMVGNEFVRGMADQATNFATEAHPELQQAIMDVTQKAAPKAASAMEGAAETAGEAVPGGIESLQQPIIRAGVGVDDMYQHVKEQLEVVGEAFNSVYDRLDETGVKWDPRPVVKQLGGMFRRNASGDMVPIYGFDENAKFNQSVKNVIDSILSIASETATEANNFQPAIHELSWKDASKVKGIVQSMANYAKPKFDPENIMYSKSGALVTDSIDRQAARAMAANGENIGSFQALRGGYSNLKVLEEALNNKYAVEKSAKSVIPVLRTAGALSLFASGKHAAGTMMLLDYLVRKYGPEVGTQMARSIAENAGELGVTGLESRKYLVPPASAITQGLTHKFFEGPQGD